MRQPRQDTTLRLPAEQPRAALARDEALLDDLTSTTPVAERQVLQRWWIAASPAVVVGLGLRHRLPKVVDLGWCAAQGVDVLHRRAGGGALLLDEHMLCGAVCVPLPDAAMPEDLTESYRWLGDHLAAILRAQGIVQSRRIEVAEARADVAALRASREPVARLLLSTCYGALSPHEVAIGPAKVVGIAQIRRREAALFQFGVLLQDQAPLADYLVVEQKAHREAVRAELRKRTVGLEPLLVTTGRSVSEVAEAIAGARPYAPGVAGWRPAHP